MIRTVKPLFVYDEVSGLTLTITTQNFFPRKTLVCIESAGVVSFLLSGFPWQWEERLIIKKTKQFLILQLHTSLFSLLLNKWTK